ncbi:oligodendrocyte transcription factor 2-like [Mizuhopecten yessoensis]|uniref:Oligodendrocyte transcription factor 2 n=1 Tax=Mizuhopecten yessoensis TaxID=6573 RepID=A0A210PRN4_MIZYE|nr:oligodendrocyte transcription factor 2-like [Mizuhopecten yessoensis]OWF39153.1 Oligodendrocyte transcription factor 2 [Mizuhopecten yessoensis]
MAFSVENCLPRRSEQNENKNHLSYSEYDATEIEEKDFAKSTSGDSMNEYIKSTGDNSEEQREYNCGNNLQIVNVSGKSCSPKSPPSGRVKEMRNTINKRERRRMQQLNCALNGLRDVIPSVHPSSTRKLSKIATLVSAKSYIQMLSKSVQEMSTLLTDLRACQSTAGLNRRGPCLPLCVPKRLPHLPSFLSAESAQCSPSNSKGFVSYPSSYSSEAPTISALPVNTVATLRHQEHGQHVYFTNPTPTLWGHFPQTLNHCHRYYHNDF